MTQPPPLGSGRALFALAAMLGPLAVAAGMTAVTAALGGAQPAVAAARGPQPATHRTSITINGARPGRVFDGVGAISGGGGTSRLLIDYPPAQQQQILDYLFKPGYGAHVQVLKLEIGGDAEATDGAEPSFEHTRGAINCNAGYEMWLARQARQRNPHIRLYALQWNAPGWVGNGAENPWTKTDIGYLIDWLHCAKSDGLTVNYLGGWNEHQLRGKTAAIMQWFVNLRASLNRHGFRKIKIVAMDSPRRTSDVSGLLAGHPAFRRAIGVLGYHDICKYPTTGLACQVPAAAKASGKPIWATEIGALRPPGGSAALTRAINNAFIQARATSIIEYPLVSSMPGGLPEEDRGLVIASQPWSGNYQVPLTTWVIAQTTQFTQPGWVHVAGASGQFGGAYGTYTAYQGPRRNAWSLVAQSSDAPAPQVITVHITGGLPRSVVHVRVTNLRSALAGNWFVPGTDIHPRAGTFTTTLKPGRIYSFTTTTGQGKGKPSPAIPAATPMPLPYSAPPDATLEPSGLEPADGSFEYPSASSTSFTQTTVGRPDFWQPPNRHQISRFPYAVVGDYCLGDVPVTRTTGVPAYCAGSPANYTVSAAVTFTKPGQSAGLLARYYRPITTPIQYFQGYQFIVSDSGSWKLVRHSLTGAPVTIASGSYAPALGTLTPHTLSLTANGSTLTASIDGNQVTSKADAAYSIGIAGICTGSWYPVKFSGLTVSR